MQRFPGDAAVFAEFAQIAVRQEDWTEALARWSEAQRRFPDDQQFAHRIFEARMNVPESLPDQGAPAFEPGPPEQSVAEPQADSDPREATRDLVMQFESLGGARPRL